MSSAGAPTPPAPPASAMDRDGPIDILLLMKSPEAAFCAAALSRCQNSLNLAWACSIDHIDAAIPKLSATARLIGFSTSIVVPGRALPAFGGGAYNFHPGPPEYPGNRPAAFACYNNADVFGVTLHRMLATVDSGEILDCERFPTHGIASSGALAILAYQRLARLFLNNAAALSALKVELTGNGEVWSGRKTTLADFEAMQKVSGDIEPGDLDRRIRAFNWIYSPVTSPVTA